MPKSRRNLNLCFNINKIKLPLITSSSSSSSSLTPDDHSRPFFPSSTATTSSHSPPLFKSYNSLYDDSTFDSEPEPNSDDSEPDFATVFASQRFFFTSPGSSNSIVESAPSSAATTPESSQTQTQSSSNEDGVATTTVKDSVAVPTFSPDPYKDFRRSMQEMVEARGLVDVKANWDYLHELLLCYLALNPKCTHKFIIGAFADLLVSLMAAEGGGSGRADDGGVSEITGGRCM